MSVYENYDETSQHFDATRQPVGVEIILGCLARHDKPLHELTVLDAGCGTGNYSAAILERVGQIEAVDMSAGMLERARSKLAREAALRRIRLQQGPVTDLPLAADSVDAAMINQVIHHLGDSAEDGFVLLRQAIAEFGRVLRSRGVLVINHCSQEQLRHGAWYYALCPEGHEALCRRFAPLEMLRAILEEAGFIYRGSIVPVDAVCQGDAYFDGRGPLDKTWRDGDSFWSQVNPEELERALATVRALAAAGDLDSFVAEHDARRPDVGQVTFVHASLG